MRNERTLGITLGELIDVNRPKPTPRKRLPAGPTADELATRIAALGDTPEQLELFEIATADMSFMETQRFMRLIESKM